MPLIDWLIDLIAPARISSTMLKRSREIGCSSLFLDLCGKALNRSLLSVLWAVGLSYGVLVSWGTVLLYPICWESLSWKDVKFCQMLSCIYWDDHMIFILHLMNVVITVIDLCMLIHPCIPGINSTWSWYMIHFMWY